MQFLVFVISLLNTVIIVCAFSGRTAENKYGYSDFVMDGPESQFARSSDDAEWEHMRRDLAKYFHGDKRLVQKDRKNKYEEMKSNLAQLEPLQSYEQFLEINIAIFQNNRYSHNAALVESLQDIVFDEDKSMVFVNFDGIEKVVLPGLNSTDEVKFAVLELIHLIAYNNSEVQMALLEAGVLQKLFQEIDIQLESPFVVWEDGEAVLAAETIATIHAITANYDEAHKEMFEMEGLEIMRNLFIVMISNEDDLAVPFKILLMLKKMIARKVMYDNSTTLAERLIADDWCEEIYQFLVGLSDNILMTNNLHSSIWSKINNQVYMLMVTTIMELVHLVRKGCLEDNVIYEEFFVEMLQYFKSSYNNNPSPILITLYTHCIYYLNHILKTTM